MNFTFFAISKKYLYRISKKSCYKINIFRINYCTIILDWILYSGNNAFVLSFRGSCAWQIINISGIAIAMFIDGNQMVETIACRKRDDKNSCRNYYSWSLFMLVLWDDVSYFIYAPNRRATC